MRVSRRICAAAVGAALSSVLVIGVTGTAYAAADKDCADFSNQEDAQSFFDSRPGDLHRLDRDGDGKVCESLSKKRAADETPAPKHEDKARDEDDNRSDADKKAAAHKMECKSFATQAKAQAAFDADRPNRKLLDPDGDGIACETHFKTEKQQVAVHPAGGVATGGTPAR